MVLIDRLINRLFISYFIEPRIKKYTELCSILSGIEFVEYENGLSTTDRLLLKLVCKFNIESSNIHIRMRKNGFVFIALSDDVFPIYLVRREGHITLRALHTMDIYSSTCRDLYGSK